MSAELTIKTMYELFCKKHPNLANKTKYDFYRKYFHENYDYRFGRPQIDVCNTCEELTTKTVSYTHLDVYKRQLIGCFTLPQDCLIS